MTHTDDTIEKLRGIHGRIKPEINILRDCCHLFCNSVPVSVLNQYVSDSMPKGYIYGLYEVLISCGNIDLHSSIMNL